MGIFDAVCGQHGQSPLRAPGWNSQNLGRHGFRFCVAGRLRDHALGSTGSAPPDFATQRHEGHIAFAPKSCRQPADAQSLQQVMSELQQFVALDPAAQDKLMADLKQVDPGLQPMFLQHFLAEAANRRREEQREAEKQKQTTVLGA